MKARTTTFIPIVLLSCALAAALFSWGYITYKSHALRKEAALIQTEAKLGATRGSYFLSIKNVLRDSRKEIAAIEGRFVQKEKVPEFVSLLESMAERSAVKIDFGSLNLDDATKLRIRMTGSGSWIDVASFIRDLEALPYAARIESVQIAKAPSQEGKPNAGWNFNLELVEQIAQ